MCLYKLLCVFILATATVKGIHYLGCYKDSLDQRVLPINNHDSGENTPESCARRCSDYIYAGVEYRAKCFCGNAINATKMPDSECNYTCTGNETKMCGGFWMLSVYAKRERTTHPSIHEDDPFPDILTTSHVYSSTTMNFNTKIPPSQDSTDSSAVYIGVAVGLLCAVGAVVVIIVLQRRGALACKHGTNTDTTNKTNPGNLAITSRSEEDIVDNHNYFILEQRAQTVEDTVDHINTADEPNEDNSETDHYNSIEITEEPYERINDGNGNYDHTTITLSTEPVTRKPDNIYNKLKLDRPGNYDHIEKHEHNMSQAVNNYDTTDLASRNDVVGDYNHITHPVCTTVTRGDGTRSLNKGTVMI